MMESFCSLFDPGSDPSPTSKKTKKKVVKSKSEFNLKKQALVEPNNGHFETKNEMKLSSTHESLIFKEDETLPPEPQLGNIEYKLMLINPSTSRFEHLVTQMKWRLREGQGEAVYHLGVEDSGYKRGLSRLEMNESLSTLYKMTERLGAISILLHETLLPSSNKIISTVLIRKMCGSGGGGVVEMSVAVGGVADVGKSSLLGVLVQGELDDGRGRARLNMCRHLHEIESGRTSSINHELLGFDSNGNTINYKEGTAEKICELSSKIVTLIDLGGHRKYLRTTISGLVGYSPHYLIFLVSPLSGLTQMTKELLTLALALQIRLIVVLSKVDAADCSQISSISSQLCDYLKTHARTMETVSSLEDILLHTAPPLSDSTVLFLKISSVSGEGVELLKKLLFLLPTGRRRGGGGESERELEQQPCQFQIDETFKIPESEIIVGGVLTQGVLSEGTPLLLGPFSDGSYEEVKLRSIRRNKISHSEVKANESASLGLGLTLGTDVRPGMVLISPSLSPISCTFFQATVRVLYHATAIRIGFQTTVHIENIRQTATVHTILPVPKALVTNDEGIVVFRFLSRPEYVKVGSRLLFREGKSKGYGTVLKTYSFHSLQNEPQLFNFN